jgi:hypothetical protein
MEEESNFDFEEMKQEQGEIQESLTVPEYYPTVEDQEVAEASNRLEQARELVGEDFDSLRPELQEVIAGVPVTGRRMSMIEKIDLAPGGDRITVEALDPNKELTLDELVFVRMENSNPPVERDGRLVVRTAYEVTHDLPSLFDDESLKDGEIFVPRLSSHWALNSRVSDHAGGDWEPNVVILAPGREMVAQNGRPESLWGPDTFFESVSPVLPEKSVILGKKEFLDKTPKVPGITYIEIGPEDDANMVMESVIKKMGYTVAEQSTGADHMKTIGLDEATRALSKQIGIEGIEGHFGHVSFATEVETFMFTRSPETMLGGLESTKIRLPKSWQQTFWTMQKDTSYQSSPRQRISKKLTVI